MTKAKTNSVVATEEVNAAVVPRAKTELVLEGDPELQLAFAMKAAKALMSVVDKKDKKIILNGKRYLEFGDWQTLARFYGCTVGIEWTKEIPKGFEARAVVYRNGEVISSAEAMCTTDEPSWKERRSSKGVQPVPDFQRRSMAQTRASAKAFRNALGWVAELAGYASTPAEEMDGVPGVKYDTSLVRAGATPVVVGVDEIEEIPNTNKPWQKKTQVAELKGQIRSIADSCSTLPLKTGKEYSDWVFEIVTLDLADQSEENLKRIIHALKVKFDLLERN